MMSRDDSLASLRKACEPGVPVYLLFDPAAGDVLPQLAAADDGDALQATREAAWMRPVQIIRLAKDVNLPMRAYPYLVLLEGANDPWLVASLELAWGEREQAWKGGLEGSGQAVHKIGGWLRSAMPGEQLATQLAGWMRLNTEARVTARYLRLADPRVLDLLAAVIGKDLIQSPMGRLQQWLYLDAQGRLVHLDRSTAKQAEADHGAGLPRLSEAQWQQMALGPVVHGAIARVWGQRLGIAPASPSQIPFAAALSAAQAFAGHLDRATSKNSPTVLTGKILELDDHIAAVALSLLYPGWESHPGVCEMIAGSAEGESLSALCLPLYELLGQTAPEN